VPIHPQVLSTKHPGAYVAPVKKAAAPPQPLAPPLANKRMGGPRGVDMNWVQTGVTLGAQYHKLREEAIHHAKLRNRYFQEATSAFVGGAKVTVRQAGLHVLFFSPMIGARFGFFGCQMCDHLYVLGGGDRLSAFVFAFCVLAGLRADAGGGQTTWFGCRRGSCHGRGGITML